jgi:hypothetical protein
MKKTPANRVADADIDNTNQQRDEGLTEGQNLITGMGQPDYNVPLDVPQCQLNDSLTANMNVSKVIRFRETVRGLL